MNEMRFSIFHFPVAIFRSKKLSFILEKEQCQKCQVVISQLYNKQRTAQWLTKALARIYYSAGNIDKNRKKDIPTDKVSIKGEKKGKRIFIEFV